MSGDGIVNGRSLQGELRIAHCGGFRIDDLDRLIAAANTVAKLLRQPIRWDTGTVGCDPSLSSIFPDQQRAFASALQEVAAWLSQPGNEREFVLLFVDNKANLKQWVSQSVIFQGLAM